MKEKPIFFGIYFISLIQFIQAKETCEAVRSEDSKTWTKFCSDNNHEGCEVQDGRAKCKCGIGKVFDTNTNDCIDTCEAVRSEDSKTWTTFCSDNNHVGCIVQDGRAKCTCGIGKVFDTNTNDCIDVCEAVRSDYSKTWTKFCTDNNHEGCEVQDARAKCKCGIGKVFDTNTNDCIDGVEQLLSSAVFICIALLLNKFLLRRNI